MHADLERIQRSTQETCREAESSIITGDTKVMGRGELDGIIINTTGVAIAGSVIPDAGLSSGDRIILTGPIGDHGIALMAARRGLGSREISDPMWHRSTASFVQLSTPRTGRSHR